MRLEIAVEGKTYRSKRGEAHEALGEVRFTLEGPRAAALIGPSGSGKTTLMRLIAGLDHDFRGRIATPDASRLGVVFQEPRLLPWASVEDNIRIVAPDATGAEILDWLARFGLENHRRHYPSELSLGLARRVALARALAVKPDLLLLDEPFASLDAATRAGLVHELSELLDAHGRTTLLISHDIEAAIRLADVIYALSGRPGRLVGCVEIREPRGKMSDAEFERVAAEVRRISCA